MNKSWRKETKTVWITEDKVEHTSEAMARQHIANSTLVRLLSEGNYSMDANVAQHIVNALSDHLVDVQEWVTACKELAEEAHR